MKFLQLIAEKIWWFITTCLGEDGAISFGRFISFVLVLYFLVQDAWFYHRTGHLIDNQTLLTQLGVMTAFYITNKTSRAAVDIKTAGNSDTAKT